MIMDATEIEISYRTARNKRMQVGVLADLNGVTKAQMEKYMEEMGIELPGRRKSVSGRKASFDVQDAMDLYCKGLKDAEIGQALGVGQRAVCYWRNSAGLLPNRGKKVVNR